MAYEFYWISGSPYAWCAMLAMEVKGLSYVSRRLDAGKREQKTPRHLARNPHGKVPVLKDDDHVVYESLAILAYLDKKHPESPLFGGSPEQTGFVWQRIFEWINYIRNPIASGITAPIFRGLAKDDGDTIKAAAPAAGDSLKWMESRLDEADYLAGAIISAADLAVFPFIQGFLRAIDREDAKLLNLGFDDFSGLYPNISAWTARIEALPGYDKTYPPHWR